MKIFILLSFFVFVAPPIFSAQIPDCKDRRGNIVSPSIDQLRQTMNARVDRPQVFVSGVVERMLPEDKSGRPHQKYMLNASGIKLQVVSNLEFGRVPVKPGDSIQVCGEFLKVGSGMVHWTHFDPHGGHPDGFSILNGTVYGETETSNY